MTEVLLPPWIIPEDEPQEPLDEGSSVFRAAFAPGIAQRQSFGGLRRKLSRRHTVRAEEKAQLLSILDSTRGSFNALRTKIHFATRGSGFGSEVLTNGTFANGTTSWDSGTEYTLSSADRILRATRITGIGNAYALRPTSSVTVTQYAPYVARYMVIQGRSSYPSGFRIDDLANSVVGSTSSGFGLKTQVFIPLTTSLRPALADLESTGLLAGDYLLVPYASTSRCALVDNGTNLLLQSDELDATWAPTRATVDDQGFIAPDGTGNADIILEDATAANSHFISQGVVVSSSAADYTFSCSLRAGTRTWACLQLTESTGSHTLSAFMNLSTGAVGTVAASGANWTNARAVSVSEGGSWFRLHLSGRKASAGTTITAAIIIAEADNDIIFSGSPANSIGAWRATLAQSSTPSRAVATTTTASTGTSQTGSALYLKGLPASTSGLLLPGDPIEINGEQKFMTAPLNSDAAQLGYAQFEPPLIRSPADNDPVVVVDPMGKFLVSNIKIENRFGTDAIVSYDLEHIYE